jgi:acyl-CoA thioester hydrolase
MSTGAVQQMNSVVSETRLRVRYAETDQMGVVYHSNFVIWFEVGRVELLRQMGFTYKQMEADGLHLPVVEMRCRYKAPALYDDEILVRSRLKNLRGGLLHFGYEVLRAGEGTLLAEGETTHLVVNKKMERISLPEKYMRVFAG